MNRSETLAILSVLKAAYPNFYRGLSAADAEAAVSLWEDLFQADPPELVGAAVKALIATDKKGFPPHIGAVKEKIRQIITPDEGTGAEAWHLVSRAISRSGYNAGEEFRRLPPEARRIVGSPEQLHTWAMMDPGTVQSVVASHFQRAYRARMGRKAELDALPPDVKRLIQTLSGRLEWNAGPALEEIGRAHV